MINEHMMDLGSRRSTIRELFEYGNRRAVIVGRENVFDFSIGNPNVPAPEAVRQAIYAAALGGFDRHPSRKGSHARAAGHDHL